MMGSRSLLGLALVALGLVFLLDAVDVLAAGPLIASWWPLIFVAAGVLALTDRPQRPIAAGVFLVIGVVVLSVTTGVVDAGVLAYVWPVALIGLGVWFATGRGAQRATVDAGDAVTVTVLMAGREIVNASPQFRGGSITALFGGVDLDLRGATPAPDAQLDVTAVFGGVEITVPDHWSVLVDGPAIFGGLASKAVGGAADAPVLRVRGLAAFGGIDVVTAPSTLELDRRTQREV